MGTLDHVREHAFNTRTASYDSIRRALDIACERRELRDVVTEPGAYRVTFRNGATVNLTKREALLVCHAIASVHYAYADNA